MSSVMISDFYSYKLPDNIDKYSTRRNNLLVAFKSVQDTLITNTKSKFNFISFFI